MLKKVIFRPISKEAEIKCEKPRPAKYYFPEWYKNIPKFENGILDISMSGESNATIKSCKPFFDTFISGYIQETWCDIYINASSSGISWRYANSPQIMADRPNINHYPKIDGFVNQELVWRQQWIPQLPDGYSMLYTHPLNRYDLPFISLTGIIDNDKYFMEPAAQHPFFVREGFNGIIPKGTPMFQMIPIKRDSWKSIFQEYDEELQAKFMKIRDYFYDGYKKMFWQKKEYS